MKYFSIMHVPFLSLLCLVCACFFTSVSKAATVSDLLITEIMANPLAVSDTRGEWFELFNPTSESVNLSGLLLSDNGSNRHTISSSSDLLINSGSYFVMARNGDGSLNGGFTADYVYSSFSLGNSQDQIIFSDMSGELLRFDYGADFVPSGGSMELIDAVLLPSNFAATSTTFGSGDFGTPGSAGSFIQPTGVTSVPIPGAAWLMSTCLIGLVSFMRKNKAV
ncbi:MAG: lamin tail domain-containing protein [Gammaproteobacteria bacterium]|nr:lamin tail domain-containing protein [Gammaproteobacteria bacterium]